MRGVVAGKRRRKSTGKKDSAHTSPTKSGQGRASKDSSSSAHGEKTRARPPKLSITIDAETDFEAPLPMVDVIPTFKLSPRVVGDIVEAETPADPTGRRPSVTKNIRRDCTRKLLRENPDELIYEEDDQGKKGTCRLFCSADSSLIFFDQFLLPVLLTSLCRCSL